MALGYVFPNQDQVVLHDFVRIDDVYRRARVEGQLSEPRLVESVPTRFQNFCQENSNKWKDAPS